MCYLEENRRARLIGTLHHYDLPLVDFPHLRDPEMLRDLGEIFRGVIQQRHSHMSLLQSTNIVGSVTAYKSGVTLIFETK